MEFEGELLNLLFKSPNSEKIQAIAEQLEIDYNFVFSKNRNNLQGLWEHRWSSSNSPFFKFSPFIDNLQFLDPFNLNGLNLLRPKGENIIMGTGSLIRFKYINEKKIGVRFPNSRIISGSYSVRKNLTAMNEINNEQIGFLEITYLSNRLRICRGYKGTLFVLRKINISPWRLKYFKRYIKYMWC